MNEPKFGALEEKSRIAEEHRAPVEPDLEGTTMNMKWPASRNTLRQIAYLSAIAA